MMKFSSKISTRWLINQPRYHDSLVSGWAAEMHLQIYKALASIEKDEEEVPKQYLQQQEQQQQQQQEQQHYYPRKRRLQEKKPNRSENLQKISVGGKFVLTISSKQLYLILQLIGFNF
jgi:hypothetical protein